MSSLIDDFQDFNPVKFQSTFEYMLFSRVNKFLDTVYNDFGHVYYVKLLIEMVNNVEWIILGDQPESTIEQQD